MWNEKCFTFDFFVRSTTKMANYISSVSRLYTRTKGETIGFNWIPFPKENNHKDSKWEKKKLEEATWCGATQTKKQGRSLVLTFLQELNLSLIVLFVCIQLKYYNDYCLRPITEWFSLLVSFTERSSFLLPSRLHVFGFLSVATIWARLACYWHIIICMHNFCLDFY